MTKAWVQDPDSRPSFGQMILTYKHYAEKMSTDEAGGINALPPSSVRPLPSNANSPGGSMTRSNSMSRSRSPSQSKGKQKNKSGCIIS